MSVNFWNFHSSAISGSKSTVFCDLEQQKVQTEALKFPERIKWRDKIIKYSDTKAVTVKALKKKMISIPTEVSNGNLAV